MSYEREWIDRRNAAGFAAECARLALVFYEGDCRSDLVAAIEIAECYAGGEEIDVDVAVAAVKAAYGAGDARTANTADAAYIAGHAAHIISANHVILDVNYVSSYVVYAGADEHDVWAAYARWVVRDLSCGRELPVLLRQAAGAAVVAGDENLAQEIVNIGRQGAV